MSLNPHYKILAPSQRYVHDTVEYARRYLSARCLRASGLQSPSSDGQPCHYDGLHLDACPNSKVIRKFCKATGKRESIIVPCGHCFYCRHKYQNKLIYRMYNHIKCYSKALFVTLTYNDEHYTEDVDELRRDITLFLKRVRKGINDHTFTYYMVCERGDLRNRCHFHLLVFWNGIMDKQEMAKFLIGRWFSPIRRITSSDDNVECKSLLASYELFDDGLIPVCQTGFVDIDYDVNTNVATYVSKYVSDMGKKLVFRSWSLGLGADILAVDDNLVAQLRALNVISYKPDDKTYHIGVPAYYKSKVFSQSERDCFFLDYLNSDDYKRKWEFYHDPDLWNGLCNVYNEYEQRTLAAYRAKVKRKAQLKKLL